MTAHAQVAHEAKVLIDIGCGPSKRDGHVGIDRIQFGGVDVVIDAGADAWPFDDNSVDGAYTSHFVEHLTAMQRVHFVNELYRVLKPKAQCTLIVPHWASNRAYGDPTHQWPPVSEMWFYYLAKEWRKANAPHTDEEHLKQGFACDFDATWGYSMNPSLGTRSQDFQSFALQNYKESAQDIHATLTKR